MAVFGEPNAEDVPGRWYAPTEMVLLVMMFDPRSDQFSRSLLPWTRMLLIVPENTVISTTAALAPAMATAWVTSLALVGIDIFVARIWYISQTSFLLGFPSSLLDPAQQCAPCKASVFPFIHKPDGRNAPARNPSQRP